MLNLPEVIGFINGKFVPVQVNATDVGVPDGVPALETWKKLYEGSPWSRFSFGSFVVLDGEGAHTYGNTGCNMGGTPSGEGHFPEGLKIAERALARFDEAMRLRPVATTDEAAKARLEALHAEIEAEKAQELPCASDDRLLSARYLLSRKSDGALDAMTCDEQGRPRLTRPEVHRMGVAALGRLLTDHRPFAPEAREHLEFIHLSLRRKGLEASGADSPPPVDVSRPLPESLMREAAVALARVAGQSWDPDSPDLVATARRWWAEHGAEYDRKH